MDQLEQQNKTLALGKLIVEQLSLNSRNDTISGWMAHYIAEKITMSELLSGEEKVAMEKEVFEVILKLWNNRWHFPAGQRPLEQFDEIFRTLQKLNPENPHPYYLRFFDKEIVDSEKEDFDKRLLSFAVELDKRYRRFIQFILEEAAEIKAKNIGDRMVDNINFDHSFDFLTIQLLLKEKYAKMQQGDENSDLKHDEIKSIERKIEELEKFDAIKQSMIDIYKIKRDSLLK